MDKNKTTWKTLIRDVNEMDSQSYTMTVYAEHYFGFRKTETKYTFRNKWRALLNMKIYAIIYDIFVSSDYGIYYNMYENKGSIDDSI